MASAIFDVLAYLYYGAPTIDTTVLNPEQRDVVRMTRGDPAAGLRLLAVQRPRAAADTLQGFLVPLGTDDRSDGRGPAE